MVGSQIDMYASVAQMLSLTIVRILSNPHYVESFSSTLRVSPQVALGSRTYSRGATTRTFKQSLLMSMHSVKEKNTLNQLTTVRQETSFENEVIEWLDGRDFPFSYIDYPCSVFSTKEESPNRLLILGSEDGLETTTLLHILPTPHSKFGLSPPSLCKNMTEHYRHKGLTIIHLHEDVWYNKNAIVKARLSAKLLSVSKRWYARKTSVKRINILQAMDFLEEHHLWGSTRAKYSYGLFSADEEEELIAVATFSPRRHVNRTYGDGIEASRPHRSHELIRFCSRRNEHVVGGISKLLKAFVKDLAPDDIVTCIDRDFGDGGGWDKIGFERVQCMPPLAMVVSTKGETASLPRRRYLVGAGVKSSKTAGDERRVGMRLGVSSHVLMELKEVDSLDEAILCLINEGLHPVYDAGVERRMLLVTSSKLEKHAFDRRKELGLVDIFESAEGVANAAQLLWKHSHPSFPDHYYSDNKGVNLILSDDR